MALPRSLRALAPLARRARQNPLIEPRRAAAGEAGERRTSCDEPALEVCPTCPPKKKPSCRSPKAERLCAQRHTFCPPPGGMRPPCEPRLPACSLTCDRLLAVAATPAHGSALPQQPGVHSCSDRDTEAARLACRCDGQVDSAAKRLRAAEDFRHANYVNEVATLEPPPPEPAPYKLAGDRMCANTHDGAEVTLLQRQANPVAESEPSRGACGPGRLAPPPQCFEIAHDTACKISNDGILDPCAHRPRMLMAVSRQTKAHTTDRTLERAKDKEQQTSSAKPLKSTAASTSTSGSQLTPSATALQQSSSRDPPTPSSYGKKSIFNSGGNNDGLTSRIIKALGGGGTTNSKGSGERKSVQTDAKKRRDCQAKPGEARSAGDKSWCKSSVAAPAPPRCREPTVVERLRRRRCPTFCGSRATPPTTTPSIPNAARRLHTCAAVTDAATPDMNAVVKQSKDNAAKLEATLKERDKYKEASRGRSVLLEDCRPCTPKPKPPAPPFEGSLQLPVPSGANVVSLTVTVGAHELSPSEVPNQPQSSDSGSRPQDKLSGLQQQKKPTKGASPCVSSPPSSANSKSDAKGRGSLLKTLQKKFTRCNTERTDDRGGKIPKKKYGLSPCNAPCAPKPLTCPPEPQKPLHKPLPKQKINKKTDESPSAGTVVKITQNESKNPANGKPKLH